MTGEWRVSTISLWRRCTNTDTDILDIINHPAFHLKHGLSEAGLSPPSYGTHSVGSCRQIRATFHFQSFWYFPISWAFYTSEIYLCPFVWLTYVAVSECTVIANVSWLLPSVLNYGIYDGMIPMFCLYGICLGMKEQGKLQTLGSSFILVCSHFLDYSFPSLFTFLRSCSSETSNRGSWKNQWLFRR